jgi:BlaI family transcriptional regulator, penicillinase repressor
MSDRTLTEGESDVMEAVWTVGEGPVRAILEALPASRPLAYTTVATFLKILEAKGFVEARGEGRRLVWRARIDREAYRSGSVRRLAERWFGGRAADVLRPLVSGGISPEEAELLRRLIDESER